MPEDRLAVEQTGVSAPCLDQNPVSHLHLPSFSGFEAFVGKSGAQTRRIEAFFHGNIMQTETEAGSSSDPELVLSIQLNLEAHQIYQLILLGDCLLSHKHVLMLPGLNLVFRTPLQPLLLPAEAIKV